MKKVLFVCSGNTCRSPMAEAIMRHLLKEKNIGDIEVASCGIAAIEGQPMSENAGKALESLSVEPLPHKSRRFKESFFDEYNLILTMTNAQKQYLGGKSNVYTLSELTSTQEVPDPYGMPFGIYLDTAKAIYKACNILLDTLK